MVKICLWRTVFEMDNQEKYPEESQARGVGDLSSLSSTSKPYAFKAETTNLDATSMNTSEIIRALYEGELNSGEVTLKFEEKNNKLDKTVKDSFVQRGPTQVQSVPIVCNHLVIQNDANTGCDCIESSSENGISSC